MRMLKRSLLLGIMMIFFIGVQALIVLNAQEECATLAQNTLADLSDACGDFGASSMCWVGESPQIESMSDLNDLTTMTSDDVMGSAVLHVPANVPLASSDIGLIYVMIGDVMIENLVDADSAFTPAEAVNVTVIVGSNVRSRPSTDGRIIIGVVPGTELSADGVSTDQAWLRVLHEEGTGWISRQLVTPVDGDLSTLPVIGANTQTLMQNFVLTSMPSDSACGSVIPSMLLVQSPNDVDATITVNGKELRFNDTIAIAIIDNRMHVFSLGGGLTSDGIQIGPGFTMSIALNGTTADGFWENVRAITQDERFNLTLLELISPDLLHSAVQVPTQEEIVALLQGLSSPGGSTSFNSSVDCSGFIPTSPLSAVQAGPQPFYWDAAPGASQYVVNVWDVNGEFLGNLTIDSFTTTLNVDANALSGGRQNVAWSVDALADGELACSTARVNIQILPSANVGVEDNSGGNTNPAPQPTACAWGSC